MFATINTADFKDTTSSFSAFREFTEITEVYFIEATQIEASPTMWVNRYTVSV